MGGEEARATMSRRQNDVDAPVQFVVVVIRADSWADGAKMTAVRF